MVYLICGVPGSGKTWVCQRLSQRFIYVPHDDHINNFTKVVESFAKTGTVITECPFGERQVRGDLERRGLIVKPYFIVETPETVALRYKNRNGKLPSQNVLTRALTIKNRANEWNAPYGTSQEIYALLAKS